MSARQRLFARATCARTACISNTRENRKRERENERGREKERKDGASWERGQEETREQKVGLKTKRQVEPARNLLAIGGRAMYFAKGTRERTRMSSCARHEKKIKANTQDYDSFLRAASSRYNNVVFRFRACDNGRDRFLDDRNRAAHRRRRDARGRHPTLLRVTRKERLYFFCKRKERASRESRRETCFTCLRE